ncbi:MAG: cytochrome c family protein [Rhizobiales bacterium]|nr:cytochrome c family protein [Hyphomicrobiales bacterium]
MDSFEINKILGALLFTCLVLLALNIAANALFSPPKPSKPGYEIAVLEQAGEVAKPGTPAEPVQPIATLLADADAKRGETTAKQCAACHTFNKGGPNRVGPNLWGIIGRAKGSEQSFKYSTAMKAKGGQWSYEDMDKFLASPKGFVPGTNMTFAGLSRGKQRAEVISYLRSLADSPQPLPKAADSGAQSGAGKPQ